MITRDKNWILAKIPKVKPFYDEIKEPFTIAYDTSRRELIIELTISLRKVIAREVIEDCEPKGLALFEMRHSFSELSSMISEAKAKIG